MIKSQDKLEYEIRALSSNVAKNDTTCHLKSIGQACGMRINLCGTSRFVKPLYGLMYGIQNFFEGILAIIK